MDMTVIVLPHLGNVSVTGQVSYGGEEVSYRKVTPTARQAAQ